jgi:hypothetical protein
MRVDAVRTAEQTANCGARTNGNRTNIVVEGSGEINGFQGTHCLVNDPLARCGGVGEAKQRRIACIITIISIRCGLALNLSVCELEFTHVATKKMRIVMGRATEGWAKFATGIGIARLPAGSNRAQEPRVRIGRTTHSVRGLVGT